MANFIVTNVFSIIGGCVKACNSYQLKAITSHDLEQIGSTVLAFHWALGTSLLLGLGWNPTGPNISSFHLESPHSALWKDPDWLAGKIT